jgi:hypothetical protein
MLEAEEQLLRELHGSDYDDDEVKDKDKEDR